jgi:hypothetical protein
MARYDRFLLRGVTHFTFTETLRPIYAVRGPGAGRPGTGTVYPEQGPSNSSLTNWGFCTSFSTL